MKHLLSASTTIFVTLAVAACSSAPDPTTTGTDTTSDALIAEAAADQDMIETFDALREVGWAEGAAANVEHLGNADVAAFAFTFRDAEVKVLYAPDANDATKRVAIVRPSNAESQQTLVDTLGGEPSSDVLSDGDLAQLVAEPDALPTLGLETQAAICGTLVAGKSLHRGQRITSCHNGYYLEMQYDGNLVVYAKNGHAMWATGTNGRGGYRATMQTDGNFVVYDANNKALWATGHRYSGDWLHLKDNGELVRDTCGSIHWRDNQYCDNVCLGSACKAWSCAYEANGGFNPVCFDPNNGNYNGAYHYHVIRSGHTVPGFCGTGLYADYAGNGHSCPTTHVLKVFYCGAP